jgi:hypothetical protein
VPKSQIRHVEDPPKAERGPPCRRSAEGGLSPSPISRSVPIAKPFPLAVCPPMFDNHIVKQRILKNKPSPKPQLSDC